MSIHDPTDHSARCSGTVEEWTARFGNEFADLQISLVSCPHGQRLHVSDPTSGAARVIDPLILQALIYLDDDEVQRLADPNLVVDENP